MKAIQTREDIILLVDQFYAKVTIDPNIGYFFTEVAALDLEKHLPIMYDFWESTLLGNHVYRGNPMAKHLILDKKSPLTAEHFQVWLGHWAATVNSLFTGTVADKAIQTAEQIGGLMRFKIDKQQRS